MMMAECPPRLCEGQAPSQSPEQGVTEIGSQLTKPATNWGSDDMNLIDVSREILGASGFRTHAPNPAENLFHFEDDALLGFVALHPDVLTILGKWREQQDAFVKTQARVLREAPVKAWNVYSVFLTSTACPPDLWHRVISIEE